MYKLRTLLTYSKLQYSINFLQSAQNRLYIKRGNVVNHDSTQSADIYIEDGTIKYVGSGADFVVPGGCRIIDAAGKLVIPGGIDPHTHFQLEFGGTVSVDDFYQGTKAAVAGGTTTISEYHFIIIRYICHWSLTSFHFS